ncbi:transposase [Modicisalibacter luteus]|uniref:Transposase n=1 Tax=Modicisalibacter luteus TaxID=453962 RepID=A0ABV7M6N8_9GAMM
MPTSAGRPRLRQCERLRRYCDRYGIRPTIRRRQMHRRPKPGLPRLFERPRYRRRNVIERLFGRMKEKRRLDTRYVKLAISFRAMVTLACIELYAGRLLDRT